MHSNNYSSFRLIPVVIALLLSAGLGCAGPSENASTSGLSYGEFMQARRESSARIQEWRTLADLAAGAARFGLAEVVLGEIIAVSKDSGFAPADAQGRPTSDWEAVGGRPVPFDDPAARWQSIRVDIRVEAQLFRTRSANARSASSVVAVGLASSPEISFEQTRTELLSWKRVVVPLAGVDEVYKHNRSLSYVLQDGELLMRVDASGKLSLPFVPAEEALPLLERLRSIEDLRSIARSAQGLVPS